MKTTKEKIAVMQAYEDGREIECLIGTERWIKDPVPSWNWNAFDYRIKQSTITVNGIEVQEPVYSFRADTHVICKHADNEAARQHYEALIAPSRVKK